MASQNRPTGSIIFDDDGRELYNYYIPPKAQDVSHWWRPYYEYKEFHVAVYALYPMTNEDMYLFIRDELTVSESAGRLLSKPGNWRCSSGRMEDVVRQHVTLCNDRLHELDEANDDSEDEEAEWNRKPVFDPFQLILIDENPDQNSEVIIITLNDDRGLCYTDWCRIPIEYAFPVIHAMQKGMCTWSAVKYIVAENVMDDDLDSNDIEQGIDNLMMDRTGVMEFIENPDSSEYRTPPMETGRPGDDDDDDDEDDDMGEEEEEEGEEEEEEEEEEETSDDERRRGPEHSIENPEDYISYSFFFFYLNPYGLIRPVKREFLREWLLYISAYTTALRPWDHVAADGILEESPHPYTNPLSPRRGYLWPEILHTFPRLLAQHASHPHTSHIPHPSHFFVWDHDRAGLMACKLNWDPAVIEGMSVGDVERAARRGMGRGRAWDERDVEVVRVLPEQDGVDWVRQVVNGTGIGPGWEEKRRGLRVQEFERGE